MLNVLSQMRFSWGHFVTAVLAIVIALGLSRIAVGRLHRQRITILIGALSSSVLLYLAGIAAHELAHGGLAERAIDISAVLLLAFGLTVLLGLLFFDVAFERARLSVPTILRDILQAVAFFIILLVVLRRSGVNLLSLVTTSAVLTAVIGLSLQNTIANMFAGLSLQLDHTLNVGDWIQMSTWIGRITHIKWRSTFIVTRDGNNVILPNSELLRQEVLNFSKPTGVHRSTVKVSFAYRHPPREVARVLVGALRGLPDILPDPAPDCLPIEFGDSGILYALRYWTDNVQRDIIVEGEVRVRIWYAGQRAGLEVPFPMRVVQILAPEAEREGDGAQAKARMAALTGIDLFAPLAAKQLELLAANLKRQSFASGELIIEQGAVGDSLYVIHRGQVAVSVAVEQQARDVATLGPGNFFGEMSLLTGEPRQATCRAQTDVDCWVIDHEAMREVLRLEPKIAEDMAALLAGRQQELQGKRAHLSVQAQGAVKPDQRLLARIRDFFHLG